MTSGEIHPAKLDLLRSTLRDAKPLDVPKRKQNAYPNLSRFPDFRAK